MTLRALGASMMLSLGIVEITSSSAMYKGVDVPGDVAAAIVR